MWQRRERRAADWKGKLSSVCTAPHRCAPTAITHTRLQHRFKHTYRCDKVRTKDWSGCFPRRTRAHASDRRSAQQRRRALNAARRRRFCLCVSVCCPLPAMSSKKAVFKPGQSGKKAVARASMVDDEPEGGAASAPGRGGGVGAKKKSLAQQIAELSNPTPKGACSTDTAGAGGQRGAAAWTVHSGAQEPRTRPPALYVRIGARLTPAVCGVRCAALRFTVRVDVQTSIRRMMMA